MNYEIDSKDRVLRIEMSSSHISIEEQKLEADIDRKYEATPAARYISTGIKWLTLSTGSKTPRVVMSHRENCILEAMTEASGETGPCVLYARKGRRSKSSVE